MKLKGVLAQKSVLSLTEQTYHSGFWYPCMLFTSLDPRRKLQQLQSEQCVELLNRLLVCLFLCPYHNIFFLNWSCHLKTLVQKEYLGQQFIFLLVDSFSFCVEADEFNSLRSNTSGSGFYGASQSKTHPCDMTVRATLKHLSSSGDNQQHVPSSALSIPLS